MLITGSIILAALNLASTWLLSKKQRTGWYVIITSNLLGFPYDILTHQYGFLATTAIALVFAVRALRTWNVQNPCGHSHRNTES